MANQCGKRSRYTQVSVPLCDLQTEKLELLRQPILRESLRWNQRGNKAFFFSHNSRSPKCRSEQTTHRRHHSIVRCVADMAIQRWLGLLPIGWPWAGSRRSTYSCPSRARIGARWPERGSTRVVQALTRRTKCTAISGARRSKPATLATPLFVHDGR